MKDSPSEFRPARVAILGVGLLGGSVARAIRQSVPSVHVVGIVRCADKGQQWVDSGVVDAVTESIEQACGNVDVVVIATPVDTVAEKVIAVAKASNPDCLITDVGSTKRTIVKAVSQCPEAVAKFVAAHPIAGSEKTGAEHATADLFVGKVVVLTPSEQTPADLLERAEQFWRLTGGRIVTLSPQDHDTHLASVSHVPHLASSAVAKLVCEQSADLVGSGWTDITRVAAGDPAMWLAICQENRTAIEEQLRRLAGSIEEVRQWMHSRDDESLLRWLKEAKTIRDSF
ncbi:prephenate dehydrogenase [Rhodopirellula maiorica SM1]|uniref:Prephenate dehydrogenase n=1 Tax=Rhodopirellula maiorica SM1 TaxID=1265738 RepID=M5RIC7_9BACT|nr:prephenate dehydrogenase [Rhodopirellula maiorica]EMI19068.1 prephenate dehydrogenase [Rhodopirellula maiorica SM1]